MCSLWMSSQRQNTMMRVCMCVYLGFSCQHIVPEDGGPGTGQLTDIRDDDNRQRDGLQQQPTSTK